MQLSKHDLTNQNYTWPEGENKPRFTGSPSRRLFDRYNGEQVLFIINFYGSMADKFTPEDGRKVEELIHNELPMEAKSEMSVINWLKGDIG